MNWIGSPMVRVAVGTRRDTSLEKSAYGRINDY